VNYCVGISEMAVSDKPDNVLVTYSLGSCVGLSLYDPTAQVGGLIHCMLPLSRVDRNKAKLKPQMFVDTGVPAMLQALVDLGADKKRLVAKMAGGAAMFKDETQFRIGERNYTVMRKVLLENSILIDGEDVGGSVARTMYLFINSGKTIIKSHGKESEL